MHLGLKLFDSEHWFKSYEALQCRIALEIFVLFSFIAVPLLVTCVPLVLYRFNPFD